MIRKQENYGSAFGFANILITSNTISHIRVTKMLITNRNSCRMLNGINK